MNPLDAVLLRLCKYNQILNQLQPLQEAEQDGLLSYEVLRSLDVQGKLLIVKQATVPDRMPEGLADWLQPKLKL